MLMTDTPQIGHQRLRRRRRARWDSTPVHQYFEDAAVGACDCV
jgi:hypothetical protein